MMSTDELLIRVVFKNDEYMELPIEFNLVVAKL